MEHILARGRALVVSDLPGDPFFGVCGTPPGILCASRALRDTAARQNPTFCPPSWPGWSAARWGGAFPAVPQARR